MTRERWIVRVFDGRAAVHVGPFGNVEKAKKRADTLAGRARRRGQNVSVTVRPLLGGGTGLDVVLRDLEQLAQVHHASSFGGRPERDGDPVDQQAEARRRRDDRRDRARRGEWPWW